MSKTLDEMIQNELLALFNTWDSLTKKEKYETYHGMKVQMRIQVLKELITK